MHIGRNLPYPSLSQILETLGTEAILVGSAVKDPENAKDYDLVVSRKGLANLLVQFGYFLTREQPRWYMFFTEEDGLHSFRVVDIFCGLQDIQNTAKYEQRITYEDALEQDLHIMTIAGVEILSYAVPS